MILSESRRQNETVGPGSAPRRRIRTGFTLIELLVVIAIITLLAALLASGLVAARRSAQRAVCTGNLRQINLGVRLYSDDSNDKSPMPAIPSRYPYSAYKELMKSYVDSRGASSPRDKLFSCPADTFYYDLALRQPAYVPRSFSSLAGSDYSSYMFNAGNLMGHPAGSLARPGIAGLSLGAIKHPARTLLIFEAPAAIPYSWHNPKWPKRPAYFLPPRYSNFIFSNAMDLASFVDGHVSYVAIFWKPPSPAGLCACHYDPPPQYNYQWSPD
jgi:prepilin-type N-terminal cleavage/methylation domain-containing protein